MRLSEVLQGMIRSCVRSEVWMTLVKVMDKISKISLIGGCMLQYLHVKNLALIDEIEVEFGRGLNILTGETGAGKSIILGSVNLALGGRYTKDILRQGTQIRTGRTDIFR